MGVLDLFPLAMLRAGRAGGSSGDRVGVVVEANAAALGLLGRATGEVVGRPVADLLAGAALGVGGPGAQVCLARSGPEPVLTWLAVTAVPLPIDPGAPDAHADGDVLVVLHDITDHKAAEERLDRAARHDPLTGLINRTELVRLLRTLDPGADGPHVAVVFLDLDGFKRINDTRGHHVGDELLVAVARRIRAAVRPEDSLARIGGDEFVIVCPRLAEPADARAVAERVRATLDTSVSIEGREHRISMSLGIALSTAAHVDPDEMLRQADMAMYRAKEAGRNTIRIHSAEMDAELVAEERIREALGAVLVADPVDGSADAGTGPGLELHYQPVVEIATGRLRYVEALARLRDAAGELVRPSAFLPVAARAGLNGALSEHVLRQALRQRAAWRAEGVDIPIGLNLAPGQVFSGSFATDALRIIRAEGDDPAGVVFEMGEFGLLEPTGPAQLTLRRLRSSGIGLAIDHFGTGYSSLGALRFLGPNRVKIDRSFVASISTSAADRAIVAAATSAAHALGQRVVAEGVENDEQLRALVELGCDEAQGFLVAHVLPADELDLARQHWEPVTLRRTTG